MSIESILYGAARAGVAVRAAKRRAARRRAQEESDDELREMRRAAEEARMRAAGIRRGEQPTTEGTVFDRTFDVPGPSTIPTGQPAPAAGDFDAVLNGQTQGAPTPNPIATDVRVSRSSRPGVLSEVFARGDVSTQWEPLFGDETKGPKIRTDLVKQPTAAMTAAMTAARTRQGERGESAAPAVPARRERLTVRGRVPDDDFEQLFAGKTGTYWGLTPAARERRAGEAALRKRAEAQLEQSEELDALVDDLMGGNPTDADGQTLSREDVRARVRAGNSKDLFATPDQISWSLKTLRNGRVVRISQDGRVGFTFTSPTGEVELYGDNTGSGDRIDRYLSALNTQIDDAWRDWQRAGAELGRTPPPVPLMVGEKDPNLITQSRLARAAYGRLRERVERARQRYDDLIAAREGRTSDRYGTPRRSPTGESPDEQSPTGALRPSLTPTAEGPLYGLTKAHLDAAWDAGATTKEEARAWIRAHYPELSRPPKVALPDTVRAVPVKKVGGS